MRRDALAGGETLVAVGTHALIQSTVEFDDLALAIVDEQHRFGVHQRMALRNKGRLPHQLVMTATPIPRTLTMALYADMDVSVIDELPPGREPVVTRVLPSARRKDAMERIASACRQGRQAYWVCTLIEESEALDSQAAENVAAELKKELRGLRVALVHGRLPGTERQTVMGRFRDGEIDVLVATTVIEVGVDVPNASLMVIENPERLGLAQLHQLRGRIGRGSAQSHCILLFEPPLTEVARARLAVMRETGDGFVIAEKDLELRGPGDVLGTRQTGQQSFRVADLMRDAPLLPGVIALGARLDDSTKATVLATWGTTVEAGFSGCCTRGRDDRRGFSARSVRVLATESLAGPSGRRRRSTWRTGPGRAAEKRPVAAPASGAQRRWAQPHRAGEGAPAFDLLSRIDGVTGLALHAQAAWCRVRPGSGRRRRWRCSGRGWRPPGHSPGTAPGPRPPPAGRCAGWGCPRRRAAPLPPRCCPSPPARRA